MDKYDKFVKSLNQKFDFDLSGYKRDQMERRINAFMSKLVLSNNYEKFLETLAYDQQICQQFFNYLTINVTEFFRNPKQWDILREKILPQLIIKDKRLYIWSAGCATGEEPYSMAILMEEFFPNQKYTILASDCDGNALQKAKEGVYAAQNMQGVSDKYKDKYFLKKGDYYIVKNELKTKISFRKHNLLIDDFPKQMDFIICRNVVIYFKDEIKTQLYLNFFNSLRSGGVLFTGNTEQLFMAKDLGYETIAPFFYRRPLHI